MKTWCDAQFRALVMVLTVTTVAALGGCYTVLRHPVTAEVDDGGEGRRDCFECHQDQGLAEAIDPLYVPAFDYYNDNYYPYYAYPWWWRQFWYFGDHGGGGGGGGGSTSAQPSDEIRHVWGRGVSTAPTPPPMYTAPAPGNAGSSPASGSGAPGSPTPQTGQQPGRTMKDKSDKDKSGDENSGKDSQKKDEPKKDDSKKDDSNSRRSGKDGGGTVRAGSEQKKIWGRGGSGS